MADIAPTRIRPAETAAPPAVSVVVPTRNEAGNVRPLVDRLRAAFGSTPAEIVFVDDSDDDTPAAIAATGARLVHRPAGQRAGGLGGAVVAGFRAATAPWVVVMDGDLQHPPETVPELLAAGQIDNADAVVASRYRGAGRADGLAGRFRRLVSRATGALAKLVFPVRLRGVTDPMSGFFAVRRDAVPPDALRPDGYKILLEVLVRGRISRVVEVPYTFRSRLAGESKASLREGLRFGRHLLTLRLSRPRIAGFALAGASGIAVNSAALWVFALGLPYLVAAVLAVQVAIGWNFLVIDRLVMPPGRRTRLRRLGRFLLLNNTLTPVHVGLLYALVTYGGLHYLAANMIAIGTVFAVRYLVTSRWVYGELAMPGVRGMAGTVRRAALTRLLLAVVLTAVAFPALAASTWDALWERGGTVPLLIPLVAASALVVARLRPASHEPDVHDRQVDGLLAAALLISAGTLVLVAPDLTLVAGVAFLAGAAILLLGTRATARLRWVMLLPLVAAVPLPSTVRPGELVPLLGAVVCLTVCAGVIGARRAGRSIVPALLSLIVVALLPVFLERVADVAPPPGLTDALLAGVVAVWAVRWARGATSSRVAARQHLPRARVAAVVLVVIAVVLGVRALPAGTPLPAGLSSVEAPE
ncbi:MULTISPECIES: glycosyltransferase [Catenuloplanes]|uniref:Glycosyltransferase involved in cell wall biosynthesis n=1 Tax=Catenuloplanes niger TaxID=587534 RepID=A0AAE3ZZF2_9ACTN|nr:glycosyltransferase [Catenuloplanes niger]MDR7328074.1 glycosyltransferase involved in cell wall biosynthesis [Catenuloplanes niger]